MGATLQKCKGKSVKNYYTQEITERHRHRYEVNPEYSDELISNGLKIYGKTQNWQLAEYIELPDHPFFTGGQAHPEFHSTFERPNRLYHAFLNLILSSSS